METPDINTVYQSKQLRSPFTQSILMLIVIALFGWFILQPKYASVNKQKEQQEVFKTQQATLEADRDELNKLINKMESSEDEVKLLDEAIPLHTRATEVSLLIESYARSSGLVLTQLNVDGLDKTVAAADKDVLKAPYRQDRDLIIADTQVVVEGNIDQFRNFLQLLENSGRIVDVESLDVASTSDGPSFRLRLQTYAFMPSDKPASATEEILE